MRAFRGWEMETGSVRCNVGIFNVSVRVSDQFRERYVDLEAMVDTGSTYAVFPESLLARLGISPHRVEMFELADNRTVEYQVGEARLGLEGKESTVPVVFAPDESTPIIGATTLEIFLLGVDPVSQKLAPVLGMRK